MNISENFNIYIREGKGTHFWWNIAYWKFIENSIYNNTNPDYSTTDKLSEASREYILNDIAYVNIKKNCENKTRTNSSDIITYAKNDRQYLIKQIDLINHDVIFCSETTFRAYKILHSEYLLQLNTICNRHDNRLIINYKYPSYFQISGGRKTLFNNLKNSLLEIDFKQFNWSK